MKIISIEGETALADINGVQQKVNLRLLDNVNEGDYVIVHTGFAISKLDEEEAKKTLDLFEEIQKINTK